ncbi:unnamed protein product [Bemisia tabaci]|uniref:Uncharacterized protein n=1 Tax=Bemisia tabaci TaxID=7038 RepID=A0A9P0A253_BEMTA|nr:unnamed protein product [Bemisia tabaci]
MELLHVWGICDFSIDSYEQFCEKQDGATGFSERNSKTPKNNSRRRGRNGGDISRYPDRPPPPPYQIKLSMSPCKDREQKQDSTAGSDYGSSVPGFNFARTYFPRVALSANSGQFQSYQGLRNTTAWRPKFGKESVSISQTTTLPSTYVVYQDALGSAGLLRKNGPVTAGLSSSTYKLILTANGNSSNNSSGNSTSCQLDLQHGTTDLQYIASIRSGKVEERAGAVYARREPFFYDATKKAVALIDVLCVDVDLNLRGLGLVGGLIRLAFGAYNQMRQTISASLQDALSTIVTEQVTNDLANRLDLDALCQTLAASNSTSYPQPLV